MVHLSQGYNPRGPYFRFDFSLTMSSDGSSDGFTVGGPKAFPTTLSKGGGPSHGPRISSSTEDSEHTSSESSRPEKNTQKMQAGLVTEIEQVSPAISSK